VSSAPEHTHAEQWAETLAGRVVGTRRFGAFAAVEVAVPPVAAAAAPGQFVMVTVPGGGFLLRRPLSIFTVRADRVGLLVEARGPGSERLTGVEVGDTLEMAGPLGTGFPMVGTTNALLVGGGIGCAPLQFLADRLAAGGAAVAAAFGFRDGRQARVAAAFDLQPLWVATEDGSIGRLGLVTSLLEELDVHSGTRIYCCGPLAMVGAVQRWALERRLEGFASLEAHMACGSGSCHGCVVATTEGYLRVCSEGPVFALASVVVP
jgi:dihydroorotate dehydrogenase electron transfer subunit